MKDFGQREGPNGATTMTRSEPGIPPQADSKKNVSETKNFMIPKTLFWLIGNFFWQILDLIRKTFDSKNLYWLKNFCWLVKGFSQPRPADLIDA